MGEGAWGQVEGVFLPPMFDMILDTACKDDITSSFRKYILWSTPEPVFVNLLRSPGIDS
jgi:hypothetical protein